MNLQDDRQGGTPEEEIRDYEGLIHDLANYLGVIESKAKCVQSGMQILEELEIGLS